MVVIDTEVYKDFFLLAAKSLKTGAVKTWSMGDSDVFTSSDVLAIRNMLEKNITVSFNGLRYDLPLLTLALSGANCEKLKAVSDEIIKTNAVYNVFRKHKIFIPANWDHVDLIEVAPGQASLKMYGARLNAKRLWDLPIDPFASTTPEDRALLRQYCENDLDLTALLFRALEKQIALRVDMSKQYRQDFRSKSDAQIAEALIVSELEALTATEYGKPTVKDDYTFRYSNPKIITFETPTLSGIFERLLEHDFQTGGNGSVVMPEWLRDEKIKIGKSEYQLGIGGLHSCEKGQTIRATPKTVLADYDVASYYPSIIMQQKLAPNTFGKPFLDLYQNLIDRRLAAKHAGDKTTADTLKIVLNGSYGKLGSKYSKLYAPELLIQTTITGQLALLMLIERLELSGIQVVSANTDGIVVYHDRSKTPTVDVITFDWELATTFELERTEYKLLASRDVNNYCAVKLDGTVKGKGTFAPPSLAKNPDSQIIYRAVSRLLSESVPVEETINASTDVTEFVTVRRVNGGAVWRGESLGKTVRFYHSTEIPNYEYISYATNTNKVPRSEACRPLLDLTDTFPADVDLEYYTLKAYELLREIGYA